MVVKSSHKLPNPLRQLVALRLEKHSGALFFIMVIFVLVATGHPQEKTPAVIQAVTQGAPQRVTAQPCDNIMLPQERTNLEGLINEREAHYIAGNKHWSRLYHWTLYGSIICSGLAALVLKLSFREGSWINKHQNDLGAIFAAVSAVVIGINAAGQYNKRWLIDRIAMADINKVKIALTNPCVSGDDIRNMLREVTKKQGEGLGGT